MKRFFWLLLILSLCVFVNAVPAKAAGNASATPQDIQLAEDGDEEPENIEEGVYDNVPWCVTADYVLEIGKDGEEYTFAATSPRNASSYPWNNLRSKITEVYFLGSVHGVGDMGEMFRTCTQITTVDLSAFDTSLVTGMSSFFWGCTSLTSIDMSVLDTSSMTNINGWFTGCSSLTDVNVKGLNTSKVTDLGSLFTNCKNLESVDLSGWETSNVTVMSNIFGGCTKLKDVNLSGWETSKVTTFQKMFYRCESMETVDLSGFDTSSAEDVQKMFLTCKNLKSLDLSGFYLPEATELTGMFKNCSALTALDLSEFKPAKAVNLDYMFDGCTSLTELNLQGFTTPEAEKTEMMFQNCSSLKALDLSDFDMGNVSLMRYMFAGCSSLETLDVSSFVLTAAQEINHMFYKCSSLKELDLSGFTAPDARLMQSMFNGCGSLESIDVSKFDTSNVTNMDSIFRDCKNLTSLDLSSFNTANVVDMDYLVSGCTNLKSLDISSFDMAKVTDYKQMLDKLESINLLKLGAGVKISGSALSSNEFYWSADDVTVYGPEEFEEGYNAGMAGEYHRYIFGDLSDCVVILDPDSFIYDPEIEEYIPTITVKLNGEELVNGEDYILTGENYTGLGTATVTVTAIGTRYIGQKIVTYEIKKQPNEITTSSESYTKTGKASAQSFNLEATQLGDATLTYKSNNSSVKVNSAGKVTISKNFIGKATITITAAETDLFAKATKKITITVKPPKVTLSKLTNPSAKKMKVTWKKCAVTSITGYEIQYATNKAMTASKKTVKVTGAAKTAYTISKLTKGKTYYVRIRAYKTVSGKTYRSAWSAKKNVKINK